MVGNHPRRFRHIPFCSKVLNPVNVAPGDNENITVAELKALSASPTSDWRREPDRKFYLSYDFNPINSWHFHDPEHYPIFGGIVQV